MLMAVKQTDTSSLELFKLALEMAERRDSVDPTPIAEYFRELLIRARALAKGDQNVSILSPDAIELALALRQSPELENILREVATLSELSPELAADARRSMDVLVAA